MNKEYKEYKNPMMITTFRLVFFLLAPIFGNSFVPLHNVVVNPVSKHPIYTPFQPIQMPWNPYSWRQRSNLTNYQIPSYPDPVELQRIEDELSKKSPLVFGGECSSLQHKLGLAATGQTFILMGGDCAESFEDFSPPKIRDDLRLLLQMSLLLMHGSGLPVVQIGRVAGQFAKPRSQELETQGNLSLLTYRGDIVHKIGFSEEERRPDPTRMLDAYHQSVQTLNLIRAFLQGGFSSVNRIHDWKLDFISTQSEYYKNVVEDVQRSLRFFQSILRIHSEKNGGSATNGNGISVNMNIDQYYTGHECLLLPYEAPLTRLDSITNKYVACSAHFLWLGERTRKVDGAHLEYLRGIDNPVGIKVSSGTDVEELVEIIKILNPKNIPGKITLISRMGVNKIRPALSYMMSELRSRGFVVTWVCDPMHGNGRTTEEGIKTRFYHDIQDEILDFFDICKEEGVYPGGIHLELTSSNATECIGGSIEEIKTSDLHKRYGSNCDPRLNGIQSLEIAFMVGELLRNSKMTPIR
jgi:3-deoxy-7-phosphoheptulonate synthase